MHDHRLASQYYCDFICDGWQASGPDRATKWPTIDRDHDGKIRLISTSERSSQETSITAWGRWYAPDNTRLYHHPLRCLGCWPFRGWYQAFCRWGGEKKTAWLEIVLILLLLLLSLSLTRVWFPDRHLEKFLHHVRSRQFCRSNSKKKKKKILSTQCPHSEYRDRYYPKKIHTDQIDRKRPRSFKLNRRDGGPN